jgi:1-deoxy-D-xylulose-5-phosphate reductoisomerase
MTSVRLAILQFDRQIGRQALDIAAREPTASAWWRSPPGVRSMPSASRRGAGSRAPWHSRRPMTPRGGRAARRVPGAGWTWARGATARLAAARRERGAERCRRAAGLAASLATLARGARLALANRETLVVGAPLVRAALARGGGADPRGQRTRWSAPVSWGQGGCRVARLTLAASGWRAAPSGLAACHAGRGAGAPGAGEWESASRWIRRCCSTRVSN